MLHQPHGEAAVAEYFDGQVRGYDLFHLEISKLIAKFLQFGKIDFVPIIPEGFFVLNNLDLVQQPTRFLADRLQYVKSTLLVGEGYQVHGQVVLARKIGNVVILVLGLFL